MRSSRRGRATGARRRAHLALPVAQAAASLGLSENHFRRDVLPHVRSIKVRIVPVIERERWLYVSGRFVDEE